ncbi:major royal jelly protein 3-like [Linepithema humile]|uniref:major royal jelly protein 3-like n=1 Tax=Linepithema humile TaxID=83485 RepID=UPI00351F25B8
MLSPLLIILIMSMIIISFGLKLNVEYEWKYIDFLWDNPQQKQQAIDSGEYDPGAIFSLDTDKASGILILSKIFNNSITNKILVDGRIFVSAARAKGVPASVMIITNEKGEGGPLLRPYPDWSWYTKNDCNSITAGVFRVYIKCNYIFILDSGKYEPNVSICPAQLLIFDLSTDKLVKRIIIPPNVADNKNGFGLLTSLTVFAPHCRNIMNTMIVFIGDSEGYGLVVYNANTSKFCRIETVFMKPIDTTFTIANQSFSLADGIVGMTVIDKNLFFAATAGHTIFTMEVSKLIKCTLTTREATKQTQVAATLSGQTGPMASEKCVLFFSNIPKTSIMCADTTKKINSDDMELIVQDSEKLQFPSGLKYLPYKPEGELLILTNRFQRIVTNTLNLSETNFRILSVDVAQIRKETNCFASCSYQNTFTN